MKKKKMQTKAVMAIFVKNTFSPVDFFVLVEYVNCFCQCSSLFKRIPTIGERKFSHKNLPSYDVFQV